MTQLPNTDCAFVAPEKITHYLLAHDHPPGGPKAAFFESFGFEMDRWEELRDRLLAHAQTYAAVATDATPYGQVYEVNGRLLTPDGRNPIVLVVWMIRVGEDFPRLVTAVPSEDHFP